MQFEELLQDERLEGREEGREEGLEEGRKEAVEDLMLLIRRMTADGLLEEIPRLDSDVAYRQEMFEKYHIKLQ